MYASMSKYTYTYTYSRSVDTSFWKDGFKRTLSGAKFLPCPTLSDLGGQSHSEESRQMSRMSIKDHLDILS